MPVHTYAPNFLSDQAHRTTPTRQFFYQQAKWESAPLCIDLGCGTGAITPELADYVPHAHTIGLDIDPFLLSTALQSNKQSSSLHFLLADATNLPLRSSITTFVLSHFTLMWIPNRAKALTEVYRILRKSGIIAALEPNYAGRIEIPRSPIKKPTRGSFPIIHFLRKVGADPFTGGWLSTELEDIGYRRIRIGVLTWEFHARGSQDEIKGEAELLREHGFEWDLPKFTYTPIWWHIAEKN